jgi:hypothetical protein
LAGQDPDHLCTILPKLTQAFPVLPGCVLEEAAGIVMAGAMILLRSCCGFAFLQRVCNGHDSKELP